MDNSLSESARFAVYREKLKGICEANNLSYVFIKNAYPIKLVIRPLGGVGEQMSMLEEASEDNYISPGASILFTVKDGNLTYRMSKTFTISDTMFNKIKNIFKNMHYLWLQFFFRDLVEGGKLAALGYKMPDIPAWQPIPAFSAVLRCRFCRTPAVGAFSGQSRSSQTAHCRGQ